MITDHSNGAYDELRQQHHPHCVVCGNATHNGLGLQFQIVEDGAVESTFDCQSELEGYRNFLHGGVVCAILDGGMTNCLFAFGSAAVTADLQVRFLQPVAAAGLATVRAWIEVAAPPLFKLAAQIAQDGETKATARARFVSRDVAAELANGSEWK